MLWASLSSSCVIQCDCASNTDTPPLRAFRLRRTNWQSEPPRDATAAYRNARLRSGHPRKEETMRQRPDWPSDLCCT